MLLRVKSILTPALDYQGPGIHERNGMKINCKVVSTEENHHLYLGEVETQLPRGAINVYEVINILEDALTELRIQNVLAERFNTGYLPPSKREEKEMVVSSRKERRQRRTEIVNMRSRGLRYKDIAKKVGVSER